MTSTKKKSSKVSSNFDEIDISTQTIIGKTNWKINTQELFNSLPITEYKVIPKKRGRPKTPNNVAEVPIQNLEPHTEMSIKENEPKVIIDTIIKHIKNKKPLKISN